MKCYILKLVLISDFEMVGIEITQSVIWAVAL